MKIISSAIFVCSLLFGTVIPGIMAGGTADDINIRTFGAPNTLDFHLYYGKIYKNIFMYTMNINN